MVGNKQDATEKNLGKRTSELRHACQVSVVEVFSGALAENPFFTKPQTQNRALKAFKCAESSQESFSPSRFRGRLAGPPLLVTAVHLSRRMAIAVWLVRCVHIFDDRQRIFKKLELWLLLTG